MQLEASYQCAACGELIYTDVDPSAGASQSYVEDCQVCCRPNVLAVTVDVEAGEAWISNQLEY